MNILIIGSGGREHALGWKLQQSPKVNALYFSPGNGGTEVIGTNLTTDNADQKQVLSVVKKYNIDFVVIGPDNVLASGLVNLLEEEGVKVFGPTKEASEIEWSKSFAKQFMAEENIPTAQSKTFSDFSEASQYISGQTFPLVIKANGLALGKGVVIATIFEEAQDALKEIMLDKVHGNAGEEVIVEEFLEGKEISIHAFCDGENVVMFPPSQDHKRVHDGDLGPNTGGMGTVAPLPWVSEQLMNQIKDEIVIPTIRGLKKRGREFKGVLFPGIMVTASGPKVIEFNARFGDPETQSYVRLLKTDLLDILFACSNNTLSEVNVEWEENFACCVTLASVGYPGVYEKGLEIKVEDDLDSNTTIFHAGTKKEGGRLITTGGRVLNVVSTAKTLKGAVDRVYKDIQRISFTGMQYRKDIGFKSL